MKYILKEEEKKNGKVNLLVTATGHSAQPGRPDPMENGKIIHLLFSRLVIEKGPIQTLESVVVSLDLQNRHSYGIFSIGKHNAEVDYDVSNQVHAQAYVQVVRGAKTADEVDAAWGTEQDTVFIPGLTLEGWMITQTLLCGIRNERIRNRAEHPRQNRGQHFEDDILDVAITQILSKVNAILNEMLYWGDTKNIKSISPETLLYC